MNAIGMFICFYPIWAIISAQKSVRKCDDQSCTSPSRLIVPEHQKMTIEMTKTQFAMRAGPKKARVLYARRKWLTIYCYDGGSIDSNTGCYESILDMNPTCSDMREWNIKKECVTGKECPPDGECWGSGSTTCILPPTTSVKVGPKALKWVGERWTMFSYHTCVSSWECLTFEAEVDIFADLVNNSEVFYYVDKDHNRYLYDEQLYADGKITPDGSKQCLEQPAMSYISEMVDATCFGESKEKVKCILKSGDEWDGVVIDVLNAEIAVLRNAIFYLRGPLFVPDGRGKIINIGKDVLHNSFTEGVANNYDLTRAASIEDILELTYSLAGTQMQAIYNLLKMSEKISSVEERMVKVIESLTLLDPTLLHKITGGIPYSVKWETPTVFEICPCYNMGEFENSNCNGEYMYKDGSYVEKNDTSQCKSYYQEEIRNVSIFRETTIDTKTIKILPPQEASSDSSAWDSLNDWRNDKISGDHNSHSYRNLEEKINSIASEMGLGSVTKWFWYATAIVAWVTGLLTIIPAICQKRS